MITQLSYHVTVPDGIVPSSSWGYWLYAALMDLIPGALAERCHQPGMTPFSQYFLPGRDRRTARWTVTALTQEAEEELIPRLEQCTEVNLRELSCRLALSVQERHTFSHVQDFLAHAEGLPDRGCHTLQIVTPTAFKHNGRYQMIPDVHQILRSFVQKWNQVAPRYALSDDDALRMLEERLLIRDYRLKSCRFDLKSQRIPGFQGTLWLQNHLPAPLMELWKVLLLFSNYAGLGIKTALGMGGVSCPLLN